MTIQDLLDAIQFPKKGQVDKKIFKKAIYENADLSKKQVELIKKDVEDIRWYYVLKPETTNIPIFRNDDVEYEEIQVIGAILRDQSRVSEIAGIIQKAVAYPVILFLEHDSKVCVSVALKRINKSDVSKNVIDEAYITGFITDREKNIKANAFIKALKTKHLSFVNLAEFYRDFMDRVKLFDACKYKDEYVYKDKFCTAEIYKIYQEIKELEEQKLVLQRQIKNETDFATKVALNVLIKNIDVKIKVNEQNLKSF